MAAALLTRFTLLNAPLDFIQSSSFFKIYYQITETIHKPQLIYVFVKYFKQYICKYHLVRIRSIIHSVRHIQKLFHLNPNAPLDGTPEPPKLLFDIILTFSKV